MSLRLLEVTVARDRLDELREALDEQEPMDAWTVDDGEDRAVIRILVHAQQTEEITDVLTDHFEESEGFRVVLLTVDATFPKDEEKEEEAEREGPERVSREELYQDLSSGSRVSAVYLVTVVLSTIVAGVGLIRDDVAAIIGAMVIAPLLAPNVALSLAATLGDAKLARGAAVTSIAGAATALAVAVAMGALVSFDPTVSQLASRNQVGLGDAALALAAGSAGALAYTTGIPTAVVGVMVAVALLPPLVAAGLFLGAGLWTHAAGAGLLTLTNLVAINLAGVVTFLVQKVRPRTWHEEEKAKTASRVALATWIALFAVMVALMVWVVGDPTPVGEDGELRPTPEDSAGGPLDAGPDRDGDGGNGGGGSS